jgi:hypothetical protein
MFRKKIFIFYCAGVEWYLRDSLHVIKLITNLGKLPPNARLFTSDATTMYTIIEPNVDVQTIIELIASLANTPPPNFLPSKVSIPCTLS